MNPIPQPKTTPAQRLVMLLGAGILGTAGALLNHWEGNEPTAYRDIIGVVTACRGVTGPGIELGRTYSEDECAEMNDAALLEHLKGMVQCMTVVPPVPQASAYLSLAYNIGVPAFCGSTLVRKLNAGDAAGACAEILRWDKAGGRVLAGLVNRRRAEYNLCRSAL